MSARICSDYCRGMRCYLRAEELLAGNPDTLFSHALLDAVEQGEIGRASCRERVSSVV